MQDKYACLAWAFFSYQEHYLQSNMHAMIFSKTETEPCGIIYRCSIKNSMRMAMIDKSLRKITGYI